MGEISAGPSSTTIDIRALPDVTPITVLHVDDEPSFAELTATFLERKNPDLDVTTSTSPNDALDRLSDGTPAIDCVVSDYDMPGTNGIELLETVRERFPSLPFILFTGKGSEEVASEAISAGVTDYLQKESGTDQYAVLANRIENAVRKTNAEQNSEQLLTAIETAREGISLLDEEGRFIYVNRAYADTYGYDPEELLGEHWKRLYPEDDVDRVVDEVLPNVPEDGVLREETRMVTADGSEIVTDHALSYTPAGLMVCNIRTLSTEFDRNGLLADVVDALDDLLFFFDKEGRLEFWNERVEAVTGYDPEELSSRTPSDFVHEDDRERMDEYVWTTREAGEARVEVRLQRDDGMTMPYEFISKRVVNDRGEVVGRIGLGRDISARKQYERRFERQNERLQYFAEIVSHDIRNPLAIAEGHFDSYHKSGDERHYETARDALDRIDSLITDVLELAQTGALIDVADYEAVEVAAVAESAWEMLRQEDASLEVESSAVVAADASRLQQLLENLLRNTIEHGEGGVTVRVGVLSDGTGLYVEDNGPSIPESEREAVFEPGHTTKEGGTGFGLATVKQLVEGHDWSVQIAESEAGGARFEIRGLQFPGR